VATDRQRELAGEAWAREKRGYVGRMAGKPALDGRRRLLPADRPASCRAFALDVDPSPFTARAAAIAGELQPRKRCSRTAFSLTYRTPVKGAANDPRAWLT